MKFIFGQPPIDASFNPDPTQGWQRLRELRPLTLVLLGSLAGIPLALLMRYLWSLVPGPELGFKFDVMAFGRWGALLIPVIIIGGLAGFFFVLVFVHELVHVLACPRFGLTPDTVLGVWPSKLLAYGNHSGPVTCRRFMWVGAAPFVVLSVVPLLVALAGGPQWPLLSTISIVNAMVCGGDALICLMLLRQVPLKATVRNKGWDTWWRAG